MSYRLLVSGSRNLTVMHHYGRFAATLTSHIRDRGERPTRIIHGGAPGADSLASLYAYEGKYDLSIFGAQWGTHGSSAGPRRNLEMLDELSVGDMVVAFPQPNSRGTVHMIEIAVAAGIETFQHIVDFVPEDIPSAKVGL